MTETQVARLRAIGELETVQSEIRGLADTLAQTDLWRPSTGLKKACDEALTMLDRLAERFDRKLVVTLVGPSGSGKSTLLNALAGDDRLSPVGHRRPTTEQVLTFCRRSSDADQLVTQLGRGHVQVRTSAQADLLENVILIDTPDTDSTHQERHIPIVHQAIGLSDVLICVFDAENPKRRDHTDFLAPYVRLFNGDSLVVVVNKCDRLAESELTGTIMPDFEDYVRRAWAVAPRAILCVSARSRLDNPGWDAGAGPRHDRNQFDQLQQLIGETFNRAGYSIDRRLENAHNLRDYLFDTVRAEAHQEQQHLLAAVDQMAASESEALKQAVTAFRADGNALALGINVRLYQQLAQRWLGPVGWMVAVWSRILVFGTGLAAVMRFGNPVRQMFGAVSAVRQYAESKKNVDAADHGTGAGRAIERHDTAIARAWPDIAEKLVAARFTSAVRDAQQAPGYGEDVAGRLAVIWNDALEDELARAGQRLSGGLLQLVFNLPVLSILAYAGWITGVSFFNGTILSSDFFVHAFWTIFLALFLSFFLLQGLVRLASGKDRLLEKVFARVREAVEPAPNLADSAVRRQAQTVLELGGPSRRQVP